MKQGDMNAIKELAETARIHLRFNTDKMPDALDRQIVNDMLVGIQRIIQTSVGDDAKAEAK